MPRAARRYRTDATSITIPLASRSRSSRSRTEASRPSR
jgi:hypothetical protein